MRRKEKPTADRYYHIYNRGVNYQNIFFTRENWFFLLRKVREYFTAETADIIAWCFMPNHYHLLVHVKTDNFGPEVMQPLMVSYTKAVNKQEARVGALFQGPYQARLVKNERYLLHLSRYIHLNPVTAGFVSRPEAWEFSSYQDYVGLRPGTLVKKNVVMAYFESARNPVFDKNRVSTASEADQTPEQAYAEYICSGLDAKAGLIDSLLFKE
jgi:REP element-mobilizing transposase RayT